IGLPSVTALGRNRHLPTLIASIGIPSASDVSTNLAALFSLDVRKSLSGQIGDCGEHKGVALMLDGIALEEVCRYDPKRDCVLGICREHSDLVNVHVPSAEDVEALETALYDKELCHHGKDGTVVAVAPITDEENYTPISLILSPSCKKEKGDGLVQWLRTVITTWQTDPNGERIHGPIHILASDGESSFRLARFILCMSERLSPDSEIGLILYRVPGLNLFTGPCLILATCDPRHIFKRKLDYLLGSVTTTDQTV
ncbi:hypothetical protein OF83DRAFT_1063117, partial [Amylostereum chailletii]